MERRSQAGLRGLDQGLQLLSLARDAGYALVLLHSDEQRAAVRVRHAGEEPRQIARQSLSSLFLCPALFIFVGADKIEKLTSLLFEQQSKLFAVHKDPERGLSAL